MEVNTKSEFKNCCIYAGGCHTREHQLHICCAFCKKVTCEIRCLDLEKDPNCSYLVSYDEYATDETREEYKKYNKIYKGKKEDFLESVYKPKEEDIEEEVKPEPEKKESKTKPATIDIKNNEEKKSTRGRRKKLTEERINNMTKDECKKELDILKIRYLYKNT